MDYGWVWIKNQKHIICAVHEFKRGKNKGKVRVTLCRGRKKDGTINEGKKVIVPFDNLIELPSIIT